MVLLNVGEKGSCSGVHIGKGELLTAAHCDTDKITVTTDKGYTFDTPAKRVAVSKEYDAALFALPALEGSVKAASLSCIPLFVGQDLRIAGHPRGLKWTQTWGKVAALPRVIEEHPELAPTDALIGPGSSGGPAYDTRGKVRGIVVAMVPVGVTPFTPLLPVRTFAFIVPSSAICKLLGRAA